MFSSLGSHRAGRADRALSLITVRRMRLAATGVVALALVGMSPVSYTHLTLPTKA